MTRRHAPIVGWLAAACIVACFAVPMLPRLPRDEIVRTTTWSLAALASFAGWGGLVARFCWPNQRTSLALLGALGASLLCAIGGPLAAASLLSKWFFLAFVALGAGLLVRECLLHGEEMARWLSVRFRAARLHPAIAVVGLFIAGGVVVQYLGGASDISSNPYDDDVSYYPFAKQLLQRGTLLDPFSFRRMSTLGGQALHQALLLTRVGILHLNTFDRSMCFLLAVGLLASHRIGPSRRRVPVLARFLGVLFLIGLPNLSINSASHYSGLALFLALFQILELLPPEPANTILDAARRLLPFALVGAALCTLRQNYQATVGLFVVFTYASVWLKLRHRIALRRIAIEPLVYVGLIGVLVLPWLVLLYRSNDTLLFPLMRGTFRADVAVTSRWMTPGKLLRFFAECWFKPDPVRTLPLFAFVGLLLPDDNPRRPLASQWLAMIFSLGMLCYAFSLSDAGNLARYFYGFATASALLTWHAAAAKLGGRANGAATSLRGAAPAMIAAVALVLPLQSESKLALKMLDARVRDTEEMLRRSVPPQPEPPVARAYHHLQEAVPAGDPILVMLDQPYLLDFARNPILNLDMEGLASPHPGIPCFRGSEPVADYLLAHGIRYVMFVFPEHSTYLYRRDIWLDHLFDPDEIWRVYAPYMLDVMDNLVELSKTRAHVGDEANMVLVDVRTRR